MTAGLPSEWSFLFFLAPPVVAGFLLWRFARAVRAGRFARRWPRVLAGNFLVFLFLGATAFLGGEIWFRYFYDGTDAFNSSLASRRWFVRHYQRNNLHVRDNIAYELRLAPGRRRISFVGDSFTAGHGVGDMEKRFGNLVRRAAPEFEVHVLAHPGFDTVLETGLIQLLASIGYEFDTVVLVYCLNDIGDLLPEWQRTLERLNSEAQSPGWLAAHSYFANTLYYRWQARRDPAVRNYFDDMKEAYRGATWAEQRELLASLRKLVSDKGGRLAVVSFPFLHALGPEYPWRFAHEQLDAFWREQGVPHLDLLPVFASQSPASVTLNRWDSHPNELAHALAAEAILKFLRELPPDTGRSPTNTARHASP